jgi:hypothetical protein
MSRSRQWIPIGGLLATIAVAWCTVVQLHGQTVAPAADLTNAAAAEVRDAQGQVILQGMFMAPVDDDDDVERHAALTPAGADTDAAGKAEIEFARTGARTQDVEFEIRNVQPGAEFTFVIDGTEVATATANRRGRAEIDVDVAIPGAAAR